MKNIVGFYEFSQDITHYKAIDNIGSFFVLPLAPVAFYYFVILILEKFLGDSFMPPLLNKIFIICAFILGVIWLIVLKKSLKGIYIYDDYLQIERHIFSQYYTFNINPKIRFDEIKSCSICPKESRSYKEWNEKQLYFMGGASDEYVRLETIYDKIYCFCIENQEEFAEKINQIIKTEDSSKS